MMMQNLELVLEKEMGLEKLWEIFDSIHEIDNKNLLLMLDIML